MIFKNKTERDIVRQIIIIPIFFIIFFTIIGYLAVEYVVIPANEKTWENQLSIEYVEQHKKSISDECKKIYYFIDEERKEQKEHLKQYLKKQNETLTQTYSYGAYRNLVENDINFEVIEEDELFKKHSTLYEEISKLKIQEGFAEWKEGNLVYQGYYKYNGNTIYLTFVDLNKNMIESRRAVLKKVMKLKFPQENYIFVLGYDGIIYGHHKKEVVENPRLKETDPRRWENLNNIIKYARTNGNSFMEYTTGTKNTPESFEDKISYLIPDDEWGIVVGFGLTKREIIERIEREKLLNNASTNNILLHLLIIIGIYMLVNSLLMFFFSKTFAKKFLQYKDFATFEKEKVMKLHHELNKYLEPKENIINDMVALAILDKNLLFKNCTKKFSELFEIEGKDIHGEDFLKILKKENQIKINEFRNTNEIEIEIKDDLFKTFEYNDVWLTLKIKKEAKGYCGEPLGFTIICEEVGEKLSFIKKYQQEQEKNLEQEQIILQQSKLAAIGTTVDSIAHQWKQPLAVVQGEIFNLVQKVRKHKTSERTVDLIYLQGEIEKIEGTINLLSDTVTSFNTFYDSSDDNSVVDITKLIKDTFKILIPSTSSNIYDITYNIEEGVYAFGVKGLYQQVILTLIHNSLDAFNEKKIKDRKFKVTVKSEGDYNICVIEDNAEGIKEDIIAKIFELNFSTKKKNKLGNSGLGLYLAKIVLKEKFEDGELSVKNVEEGVAFTIKTKNMNLEELN